MARKRKLVAAGDPGVDIKNSRWFIEFTTPHEAHMHAMKRFIVQADSPFQKVEIAESYQFGRCLMLDGKMQSAEKDEFIYHEALVHPALVTHPNPRRVAIIGGGEGATQRHCIMHPSVEKCWMIDIDRAVMDLSRKYLPEWGGKVWTDKRCIIKAADGRKFLEKSKKGSFDVIIIDLSEPVPGGPSYMLFTKEFYRIVAQKLTPDGVISLQCASTQAPDLAMHAMIIRTLRTVFPYVRAFSIEVPAFDLPWGIAVAGKTLDAARLTRDDVDRRLAERRITGLKYYDGITHEGIFRVPKYLRTAYSQPGDIITDDSPLFTAI
ncbi:MAG: polyamine aminopropyltransferase [Candidatus Coatesbacteria bacterium]